MGGVVAAKSPSPAPHMGAGGEGATEGHEEIAQKQSRSPDDAVMANTNKGIARGCQIGKGDLG